LILEAGISIPKLNFKFPDYPILQTSHAFPRKLRKEIQKRLHLEVTQKHENLKMHTPSSLSSDSNMPKAHNLAKVALQKNSEKACVLRWWWSRSKCDWKGHVLVVSNYCYTNHFVR
jgi:hypothetical protein